MEPVGQHKAILSRHLVVAEQQAHVTEEGKLRETGRLRVLQDVMAVLAKHLPEADTKDVLILHEENRQV